MASFVKFELEDGTIVFVETTDTPKGGSGFPLSSRGEHPSEQSAISFEKSIQSVRKMAAAMVQEMRDGFTEQPDEMQINFGMKASGEVGALVVSRGGTETNYNVMLRWRKKEEKSEKKEEPPAKEESEA
jgi:hypothetical protein